MRDDNSESKKRNTNIVTVLWEEEKDLAKGGQLENDASDDGNYDKQKQRILRFIHTNTHFYSPIRQICLRNNDDY